MSNLVSTRTTGTECLVGSVHKVVYDPNVLTFSRVQCAQNLLYSLTDIPVNDVRCGDTYPKLALSVRQYTSLKKTFYQTACNLSEAEQLVSVRFEMKSHMIWKLCESTARDSNPEHLWTMR
jgi:hypothetical protein